MNGWRKYRPEDDAAVRAIFVRQQEKLGMNFVMPDLQQAPVVMVMVQEIEGKIVRAFTVEAVAEAAAISDSPISAAEMLEVVELARADLLKRGFTLARAAVPSKFIGTTKNGRPSAMRRFMKKIRFTEENGTLTQFYRWLEEEKTYGADR